MPSPFLQPTRDRRRIRARGDRGYRAFLRSIRYQPGFKLKLLAAAAFITGDVMTMATRAALETGAAAVLLVFGPGYLFWRWFGPSYDKP